MNRRLIAGPVLLLTLAWAAVTTLSARQTAVAIPEPRPTFRSGVTAVAVDVSVRARNNPVPGLGAGDFQLLDNGVAQRIDAVSIEPIPLDISILLDVSGSSYGWVQQLERNVAELAALLTPADRFRVVCFGLDVREVVPMQSPGEPIRLGAIPYAGGTSLYDALLLAMVHDSGPDRRHLVVPFTDGGDTTSILPVDRVIDLATRSDASVHLVLLEPNDGNPTLVPRWALPVVGRSVTSELERIVESSGGRVHRPLRPFRPSVPEEIEGVLADYRTRYLLRYSPAGVAPGGWHQIEVKVPRHPRATIRARKGYFGGPG